MELVLATRNPHKLREVMRILAPYALSAVGLPERVALPAEDGVTFAQNALGKARAAALALDTAVIADDSGIESAALGGRPGVRSARYAGAHASDAENRAKLRREVPAGSALRYVCALAYVNPHGQPDPPGGGPLATPRQSAPVERVFFGACSGVMAPAPAGERGFGYDPLFIPERSADRRTIAQLTDAEKDAIGHRGRALRALAAWLTGARDPC